jgi:hypothetical protein
MNSLQKYGHVAFDSTQKAVLTSCVLRYKPRFDLDDHPSTTSALGATISAYTSADQSASNASAVTMNVDGKDAEKVAEDEKEKEKEAVTVPREEKFINCCFSFTIRRDKWGIPSMIVGNFIAC